MGLFYVKVIEARKIAVRTSFYINYPLIKVKVNRKESKSTNFRPGIEWWDKILCFKLSNSKKVFLTVQARDKSIHLFGSDWLGEVEIDCNQLGYNDGKVHQMWFKFGRGSKSHRKSPRGYVNLAFQYIEDDARPFSSAPVESILTFDEWLAQSNDKWDVDERALSYKKKEPVISSGKEEKEKEKEKSRQLSKSSSGSASTSKSKSKSQTRSPSKSQSQSTSKSNSEKDEKGSNNVMSSRSKKELESRPYPRTYHHSQSHPQLVSDSKSKSQQSLHNQKPLSSSTPAYSLDDDSSSDESSDDDDYSDSGYEKVKTGQLIDLSFDNEPTPTASVASAKYEDLFSKLQNEMEQTQTQTQSTTLPTKTLSREPSSKVEEKLNSVELDSEKKEEVYIAEDDDINPDPEQIDPVQQSKILSHLKKQSKYQITPSSSSTSSVNPSTSASANQTLQEEDADSQSEFQPSPPHELLKQESLTKKQSHQYPSSSPSWSPMPTRSVIQRK